MNEPADPQLAEGQDQAPVQMGLDEAIALAVQLHQSGRLPDAEHLYQAVLSAAAGHVDALHFLGLLLCQTGRATEGIESIRRAIAIKPDYVDAHNNLGNVLRTLGRSAEATNAYRRAIALAPDHAQAHNNLGVVFKGESRYDEARAALQRAIALDPDRGDAHFNLANVLSRQGRRDEAIREYRRAIELMPKLVHAYNALGHALQQMGRRDEAAAIYRQLLERVPDNPIGRHMLAACTGRHAPRRASDEYVTELFDQFADNFEHKLDGLEYRAPSFVATAIASELPVAEAHADVLDAGCGTGLCGPLLRPYARRLTGVDLSSGMLAKARNRKLYDELAQAELTLFMNDHADAYDLIASADTLVYFGELGDVLTAAAGALRENGVLVFSLEDGGDGASGTGFQLQPHGRYCHAEAYVRAALAHVGLGVSALTRDVVRKEGGTPVAGLIVTARKA